MAKGTLDKLLGRLVKQLSWPLSDQVTLWENSLPRDYQAAVAKIRQLTHPSAGSPLYTSRKAHLPIKFPSGSYVVQLTGDPGCFITFHHAVPIPVDYLQLSHEDAQTLEQWCEQTDITATRIAEAWYVIENLFQMAGTAGQLKRMAPDLLRYLPGALQAAALSQDRRSRLPPEWTTFPKEKVRNMTTLVATCYMLDPKVLYPAGAMEYLHGEYNHITWAKRLSDSQTPVSPGFWLNYWSQG